MMKAVTIWLLSFCLFLLRVDGYHVDDIELDSNDVGYIGDGAGLQQDGNKEDNFDDPEIHNDIDTITDEEDKEISPDTDDTEKDAKPWSRRRRSSRRRRRSSRRRIPFFGRRRRRWSRRRRRYAQAIRRRRC